MALFFAIAAKEVWEAIILENGSLRGKKAATHCLRLRGDVWTNSSLSWYGYDAWL